MSSDACLGLVLEILLALEGLVGTPGWALYSGDVEHCVVWPVGVVASWTYPDAAVALAGPSLFVGAEVEEVSWHLTSLVLVGV